MQHKNPTNNTNRTTLTDKKSLKINMESLESDDMTDDIFATTAYAETIYHISSDDIDRVFDGNAIHFNEVNHSNYDDSDQLKE